MNVSSILVNTGQQQMEVGFENSRLPPNLGPFVRPNEEFGYGVQVVFTLEGIPTDTVSLRRFVTHQASWNDPLASKLQAKGVAAAPKIENLRTIKPIKNDDPSPQNVKRDINRVMVFDGPGPMSRFVLKDDAHYPISFEGRFKLVLTHDPSGIQIGIAEYYLNIRKDTRRAAPVGAFTALRLGKASLRTHVMERGGAIVGSPSYSIAEWAYNEQQMSL